MCAPRVTRHTSIRYSSSCHTRVNMGASWVPSGTDHCSNVYHIDAPMLKRVWQELEYRIDVCRVTRDAHIEHL
jgi:hypothetical protein